MRVITQACFALLIQISLWAASWATEDCEGIPANHLWLAGVYDRHSSGGRAGTLVRRFPSGERRGKPL